MVELQLPKLTVRVRFPSLAPVESLDTQLRARGSLFSIQITRARFPIIGNVYNKAVPASVYVKSVLLFLFTATAYHYTALIAEKQQKK